MIKFLKELTSEMIWTSILYILIGAVLMFSPEVTMTFITYAIGTLSLLYGVMHIYQYVQNREIEGFFRFDLFLGILMAAFGIFIYIQPVFVISILPIMTGIIMLINGISQFQRAMDLKKAEYERWNVILLTSILMLILAAILIFYPFDAVASIVMLIGACFIFNGISDLWSIHCVKQRIEKFLD